MTRSLLLATVLLTSACASRSDYTISSMNFSEDAVSPVCAQAALMSAEGFAVSTAIGQRGDAAELSLTFNTDLPVTGLIRPRTDGTSEVSFFTKLDRDATPLDRREADFAVRRADQAVYLSCTEDGQTYGPGVILEPEIEE